MAVNAVGETGIGKRGRQFKIVGLSKDQRRWGRGPGLGKGMASAKFLSLGHAWCAHIS